MRHFIAATLLMSAPALADPPSIENVTYANGRFDVTLLHADTGWDDYADGWEILSLDGTSLGFRKLHHPHVNEQPFTRSLGGVTLPDGTSQVLVRARTNVSGWSEPITVDIGG